MNKNILYFVCIVSLFFSCNKESITDDTIESSKNEIQKIYTPYDLEFISRIQYLEDENPNFTSARVSELIDRNGIIQCVGESFYATQGIFASKINKSLIDIADIENSSVAITNEFINSDVPFNPYVSNIEWDFDKNNQIHIYTYTKQNGSLLPNYTGASLAGYYNASIGKSLFSFKNFPSTIGGYARNVNNNIVIADFWRSKAYFEQKKDSSWQEFPLPHQFNALSFDFETAGSDYGIGAILTSNSLICIATDNQTWSNEASITTSSNIQFAGWDGAYTVAIYKNPNNTNNPYIVIRRNTTADIYNYNIKNSSVTKIYSGLQLPQEFHFPNNEYFGDCDFSHNFLFSGNSILLVSNNLYKLQNQSFEPLTFNFPLEHKMFFLTADSYENGFYLAYSFTTSKGKEVSDIVSIGNK